MNSTNKYAIRFFNFEIYKYGIYKIKICNYENLIVRKSRLKFFTFNKNKKIDVDNLSILIEG